MWRVSGGPRRSRAGDVANTFPETLCAAFRRARRPTHEEREHSAPRRKKESGAALRSVTAVALSRSWTVRAAIQLSPRHVTGFHLSTFLYSGGRKSALFGFKANANKKKRVQFIPSMFCVRVTFVRRLRRTPFHNRSKASKRNSLEFLAL